MQLIIREYLSMLKESGELDALLPDLLLAMGLELLSRPAVGPRQFGVDLPAVGVDPADGTRKLFLITVKQGDITRDGWDAGKQAVRPSLNEIQDSYLRTRVRPKHQALPKKIILATGGQLKQDVEPDWTNYSNNHSGPHPLYGDIEFDFWGADQLALLIERFVLDEYLFPESAQKQMRKTIALADQNEDEPRPYYTLIEDTLFGRDLPKGTGRNAQRKRQKALRLLNLSLNIVFHWCQEADNLRPALLCGERTVLRTWDWMRQWELLDDTTTLREFAQIFSSYLKVALAYSTKLQPHCRVRDGLFGYGADEIEYALRTFEVIGILSLLSVTLGFFATTAPDQKTREPTEQVQHLVVSALTALIDNNPSAVTPLFDEHAIEIALGLVALSTSGLVKQAADWLEALSRRIVFAYQMGRHFPVASDAYEDLVALQVGQAPPKEQLMSLSTLLPLLAEWHVVLNLPSYPVFQQAVMRTFPQTDLQLWYPDDTTDACLYQGNAGHASGATLTSIRLPATTEELRTRIIKLRDERDVYATLSCVEKGWPMLGLMASRHFRTPIIPAYWQRLMHEADGQGNAGSVDTDSENA